MNIKRLEYELDMATGEFLRTYTSFRDAAVKLMNIMNIMRRRDGKVHEFMIQIMGESEQMVEKCFGLQCLAEEEKEKK